MKPNKRFERIIKLSSKEKPRVLKAHVKLINKSFEDNSDLEHKIRVSYNKERHELVIESSSKAAIDEFVSQLPPDVVESRSEARLAARGSNKASDIEDEDEDPEDEDNLRRKFIHGLISTYESMKDLGLEKTEDTDSLQKTLDVINTKRDKRKSDDKPKKKKQGDK